MLTMFSTSWCQMDVFKCSIHQGWVPQRQESQRRKLEIIFFLNFLLLLFSFWNFTGKYKRNGLLHIVVMCITSFKAADSNGVFSCNACRMSVIKQAKPVYLLRLHRLG